MDYIHVPVLFSECMSALNIKPDGIYVDGTLGRGGHSWGIAERLETGRLICIDRDESAICEAEKRLSRFSDKITFIHGNFRQLAKLLDEAGVLQTDGMLFDLGVSSPQLDDETRGFSYMSDAPLDMRMDRSEDINAWEIVNRWPEAELKRILLQYGEERYAGRIASAIAERRDKKTIDSTLELVEIIKSAMPYQALREKQHPAKRSFQAIRIAVNDELSSISDMLPEASERLRPGGRLAVISFHSLEDRIVKNAIRSRESGCTCPPDFPVCVCGFRQTLKSVTKKPITPSPEEMKRNPRARSAKLRVAERI